MAIDIRQLRYFLAVAEERSFTRGAERLHMAQPPLSLRIRELEAEIGAPLFDRDRRPLRLTRVGQVLLDQAMLVTEAMDRLKASVRDAIAAPRDRFVLGLVPSTLYARFPQVVARFRERLPEVDIGLAEMDTKEQVQALADGRIDVGFDRVTVDEPALRHEILRTEPLFAALPADDPMLVSGDPVALRDLLTRPLLLYPREARPSYADHVLAALHARGAPPGSVIAVRELQTALVMVAARVGICLVPESVRRMARPDIGFAAIAETISVPLLMRFRAHDASPALAALFAVYADLYAEWGWPLPPGLAMSTPAN